MAYLLKKVLWVFGIIILVYWCPVNASAPANDFQSNNYAAEEFEFLSEYVPSEVFPEIIESEDIEAEIVEPETIEAEIIAPEIIEPEVLEIVISAAGDCTLGGDLRLGPNGFMRELYNQDNDYTYFLRNVAHIFNTDDLTIVNMEGTFADPGSYSDKTFILRGPPELVNVFTSSGVDAVTIANNHSMDYLRAGYDATVSVLGEADIVYFGDEYMAIVEVKGIHIGMFGYTLWGSNRTVKNKIDDAIRLLREEGADIVIAYYHWGIERDYYPLDYQIDIAHHTIDSGADLVLASHPHVLQGIEEYDGKNIVYSLGNFCFGANNNPDDKDTMIFQQTFVFTDGVLTGTSTNIIPCSISSVRTRNNYQPTILEGAEAERVLAKIARLSEIFR